MGSVQNQPDHSCCRLSTESSFAARAARIVPNRMPANEETTAISFRWISTPRLITMIAVLIGSPPVQNTTGPCYLDHLPSGEFFSG
jgi:hypothetical protein